MLPSRRRLILLAFGLLVTAWTVLEVASGGHAGLLYLGPALLLCAPLLAGYYVGEERILALAGRAAHRPRARAAQVVPPRTRPRAMARGGRLVARSLAKRPPPRALAGPIA